jgi:hypothetical protein
MRRVRNSRAAAVLAVVPVECRLEHGLVDVSQVQSTFFRAYDSAILAPGCGPGRNSSRQR